MACGKRYSRKREAILELLRSTRVHPTADWVYRHLKEDYPDLSLATVYRNLTAFREEGVITSVGVVLGHERFDADLSSHSHAVCRRCGRVNDLPSTAEETTLTRGAAPHFSGQLESCQLLFRGICQGCLDREKENARPQKSM